MLIRKHVLIGVNIPVYPFHDNRGSAGNMPIILSLHDIKGEDCLGPRTDT